ncbi:cytochrome P450 [Sphingobium sp. Sx8-8]|uniref:cytochrome P450 n=1 Tax=Sphingobium sp. Sx8-8 TaxID=2933617 RepID=UPI001F5A718F|nr:cytochrome P450 [Sphingobium sp. Sx8-8]
MRKDAETLSHPSQFGTMERHVPDHVPADLVFDFEHYSDPTYALDPFGAFDRVARDAPPIFWSPLLGGFWVVTRFQDVFEVYRDNRLFSSAQIGVPAAVMPYKLRPLQSDPPEHKSFRRLLEPAFTRQQMQKWNPRIREISRELFATFRARGECEFIAEFARFLPNRVFMALLGLPEENFETFMRWERALLHGESAQDRMWGMHAIEDFVADHFLSRRGAARTDDLTDFVVHGELDGRLLDEEELKSVGFMLYIAGLDTVQAMLGWAFRHLAIRQDDQRAMRGSDEARARGMEEILRMHGIVASARTVFDDCEFCGVAMKKGDRILCSAAFGNRDPGRNLRGGDSDISVKLNPHMTFGAGPHLCLGMHLARNELDIVFQEAFSALPQFRLAKPARMHAGGVFGVTELQLRWDI